MFATDLEDEKFSIRHVHVHMMFNFSEINICDVTRFDGYRFLPVLETCQLNLNVIGR